MNNENDSIDKDVYARLAKDSYNDHVLHSPVSIDGVVYQITDTVNHSKSGFEATAYQRADGDVFIGYRGTEATSFGVQREAKKDLSADKDMVQKQTTAQQRDAEAFTLRVLERVQRIHPDWDLGQHVHVTGHSLGGTHAEIEAARHHLGGAAFNAFGGVDLKYGVPEGQPKDAPAFVGYARATDVVSSASRHYGTMHIYATQADVERLRAGHYLEPASAGRITEPLLTGSLSAHFINNFSPDADQGESIMNAANEARYERNKPAFDWYRHDVMVDRIDLHTLLDQDKTFNPVSRFEQELNQTSAHLHIAGQTTELAATLAARSVQSGGNRVRSAAEDFSHQALAAGRTAQATSDEVALAGHTIAPVAPGLGLLLEAEARASGFVSQHAAEDLSGGAHVAGQTFHSATDALSRQMQATGEAVHSFDESASQTLHQVEQATERTVARTYEIVTHPDYWLKGQPQSAHASKHVVATAKPAAASLSDAVATSPKSAADSGSIAPASVPERRVDYASEYDPRHPDSPNHALYNELHRRIPDASEKRLLQFTDACHSNKITVKNLGVIHLDEHAGRVTFTTSWPPQPPAIVDIKTPSPEPQQSIRHIQQYDQQQIQRTRQIHAQKAPNNQQGLTQGPPPAR